MAIVRKINRLGCLLVLAWAMLLPGLAAANETSGTDTTGFARSLSEWINKGKAPEELHNRAIELWQKGDKDSLDLALGVIMQAEFAYRQRDGDPTLSYAWIRQLRGDVYLSQFQFAKALEVFAEAEAMVPLFVEPLFEAMLQMKTGLALQGLSRYEETFERFRRVREIHAGHDLDSGQDVIWDGLVADSFLNAGISHESLKQYEDALDLYGEAYNRYSAAGGAESAGSGYAVNNIAWVYRRLEDYEASYKWFTVAKPIIEKHDGRHSYNGTAVLINLGIVEHLRGNHDAAIRWTMQAVPYMQAHPETTYTHQRWAYETMADAFRAKGDRKRAITFAKLAVNAHQAIRSLNDELAPAEATHMNEEWQRLYQSLADLLIEEGRLTEAQAVLNMLKEQEVFEYLRRDETAPLTKTRLDLNDFEIRTTTGLDDLSIPLEASQEYTVLLAKLETGELTEADDARLDVLEETLQQASDTFMAQVDAFLADVAPDDEAAASIEAGVEQVGTYQAILDEVAEVQRAAILQVAAIEDSTHLFLTLPHLTLHERVDIGKPELARLTFDALQAIEQRAPEANRRLQTLHDALLAPVSAALEQDGIEVVMLNLDGFLRYVPFAALYDGERYAIEKFAFALFSSTVQTQFRRAERRSDKTAGFGVTAPHPGFSPLPGVRDELEAIFLGEDQAGILHGQAGLDAEFDEKKLRRALGRRPSILHIASHFSLRPGRVDESFLLLGDGSHLPLSQIRKQRALRFRGVDLLTLSACQTARGGDGSEIEGFGATAQMSGASSVLASLWPVSDDATPRLMHDFYESMMVEGQSKANALRQAQLAMLASETAAADLVVASRQAEPMDDDGEILGTPTGFRHPYYWSAFVLMGNWL